MRTFALLLTSISLAASLVSCNQQVKEERLQRVDSLGIHLNFVAETLHDFDSVMLMNRIGDVDRTSTWVYDNVTDTLDRKPGIAFGDFQRTKKYLTQALTRYGEVSRELRYSEQQLENLRKDVKESFYSEAEFAGYFKTESRSIGNLVNATDELKEKYDSSNGQYTALKPMLNEIVDSIKSVIYAPGSGTR
ncbi:MAG: hypothetical protein HQ500_13005 [Flavobacteriales bacterium]|nr:hypothetical protein [Flavobacteriales bacterium]